MGDSGDRRRRSVRAVLVNWNAAELTARSVGALRSGVTSSSLADIELHVVIVDNASTDGSTQRLRDAFPDVLVIANTRNVGFAAACNQAMSGPHDADHVLLVNNDAVVDADALVRLVDGLEQRPAAGAAVPTLLLEADFVAVDGLPAALRIERISVDGVDVTRRCIVHDATIELSADPPHHGVATTTPTTTIEVPLAAGACVPAEIEVVTSAPSGTTCHRLRPRDRTPHRLVNSVGADRTPWGEGFDRDFGRRWEPGPSAPAPETVPAFSGGAVLLRTAMLDAVGGFAPGFFAYAEDTDLSWRAERHGWTTVLVPDAVVHHRHGATAGPSMPGFRYLNHRNWILTVLRNGRPRDVLRAVDVAARRTIRAVRADWRSVGDGRRSWHLSRSWARVWWAVIVRAPLALAVRVGWWPADRGRPPSAAAVRRLVPTHPAHR